MVWRRSENQTVGDWWTLLWIQQTLKKL
jgi:hypothetical protein